LLEGIAVTRGIRVAPVLRVVGIRLARNETGNVIGIISTPLVGKWLIEDVGNRFTIDTGTSRGVRRQDA
jgi:hypothetical protein